MALSASEQKGGQNGVEWIPHEYLSTCGANKLWNVDSKYGNGALEQVGSPAPASCHSVSRPAIGRKLKSHVQHCYIFVVR